MASNCPSICGVTVSPSRATVWLRLSTTSARGTAAAAASRAASVAARLYVTLAPSSGSIADASSSRAAGFAHQVRQHLQRARVEVASGDGARHGLLVRRLSGPGEFALSVRVGAVA